MHFGHTFTLYSASNVNVLAFTKTPSHVGRNEFQCVVMSTTGDRYVRGVNVTVKGITISVSRGGSRNLERGVL